MTNKTNEVLRHLQKHKTITSRQAIELFTATRLSRIIFDLRKKGYNIITRKEECIDRYGNTCQFARYIYLGQNPSGKEVFKNVFGDLFNIRGKK